VRLKKIFLGVYLLVVAALSVAFMLDIAGFHSCFVAFMGSEKTAIDVLLCAPVAPFPLDPLMQKVMSMYANAMSIADRILFRIPVLKRTFGYYIYDKRDTFTIPNTLVGRSSDPNLVQFAATRATGECLPYGLGDFIPQSDISEAEGTTINPVLLATEGIARLIDLDREKRVADLLFAAGTYPSGNKVQLTGNDQWNSGHADGDPIADITAGLDACLMRPNHMAIGRAAFSALSKNPYILKAVNRTSGDAGIASRKSIADLFELKDIYVGEGWANTAKKGQTATMSRLWGKHCLLFYKDETVRSVEGITFGFTAHYTKEGEGGKIAGQKVREKTGLTGGVDIWAGEIVKEVVIAPDLGYFIQDCAA
jgi:hypothetical protein